MLCLPMNLIRHICRNTFDKCLVILHPKKTSKDTHEYSNVTHEMKEGATHLEDLEEEEEDKDSTFAAWPTKKNEGAKAESPQNKETTKMTQSPLGSEPSAKEKRSVLIGNLDEESINNKKEQDNDDQLFAKMSMEFGSSPNIKINKTVVDSKNTDKKSDSKDRLDKFKMDEDLEPTAGWGDDDAINI